LLALEYLHAQNIIHRDLKPKNVFLKGKEYTVQLGDFGIAAQNKFGVTRVEDVGTMLYQAPEMFEGQEYDERADIWSLGCTIY
jgi:serine/threonine protein kinase